MSTAEAGGAALVPELYREAQASSVSRRIRWRHRIGGMLRSIRPELVSGASDNDPTNVGTAKASSFGNKFGNKTQ